MTRKKVFMVIAPEKFREEEYFETKKEIEKVADVITASTEVGDIVGMFGERATATKKLSEIDINRLDAIVFVGGVGAKTLFSNSKALSLAKDAHEKGKIVAAICISPTILANAGVLKGKKATIWKDNDLIENLKSKGSEYVSESVVKDGKIITANGPSAAKKFGQEIVKALEEQD